MKKSKLIPLLVILISISCVFAQSTLRTKSQWETAFFKTLKYEIFVKVLDLPAEWVEFPEFIYYFLFPILGVIVIVYGFLDTMRIFDNNSINIILAVIIGFSFQISGFLGSIVKITFGLLGPISVVAFALLFVGGLGFISKKKRAEWGTKAGVMSTYHDEADRLQRDLKEKRELHSKLMRKYARAKNRGERHRIEKNIKKVKEELDNLEVRLEEMKDVMDQPG